jgi:hypothetical protein
LNEWKNATDQYQIALNINADNVDAKRGLDSIERCINGVNEESEDEMDVNSIDE